MRLYDHSKEELSKGRIEVVGMLNNLGIGYSPVNDVFDEEYIGDLTKSSVPYLIACQMNDCLWWASVQLEHQDCNGSFMGSSGIKNIRVDHIALAEIRNRWTGYVEERKEAMEVELGFR
jgi:hypothetical protein